VTATCRARCQTRAGPDRAAGVAPDIETTAEQARDTAYARALQDVITAQGAAAAEAEEALAALQRH
jgi:hypothetical protein